jgi:hypothetical protein
VTAIAFLGVAIVISLLGSLVLWLRHRNGQRPRGVTSGIDEFTREMRALAPDRGRDPNKRGS